MIHASTKFRSQTSYFVCCHISAHMLKSLLHRCLLQGRPKIVATRLSAQSYNFIPSPYTSLFNHTCSSPAYYRANIYCYFWKRILIFNMADIFYIWEKKILHLYFSFCLLAVSVYWVLKKSYLLSTHILKFCLMWLDCFLLYSILYALEPFWGKK